MAHSLLAGDPSLRLKNGSPQDDAIMRTKRTIRIQTEALSETAAVFSGLDE